MSISIGMMKEACRRTWSACSDAELPSRKVLPSHDLKHIFVRFPESGKILSISPSFATWGDFWDLVDTLRLVYREAPGLPDPEGKPAR